MNASGKKINCAPLCRCLANELARLVHCGFAVEEDGRSLDDGDSCGFEVISHVGVPGFCLIHKRDTKGRSSIG